MNTIVIIGVLVLLGLSIGMFIEGTKRLAKAEGIIDTVSHLINGIVDEAIKGGVIVPENLNLHKEERKEEPVKPAKEIKDVMKKNIESAVYSGVMHIFVRNKIKKERAVMTYKWKDEDVYFEYDEAGNVVRICGDAKKQLLNVLNGGKERNFKKYELVI